MAFFEIFVFHIRPPYWAEGENESTTVTPERVSAGFPTEILEGISGRIVGGIPTGSSAGIHEKKNKYGRNPEGICGEIPLRISRAIPAGIPALITKVTLFGFSEYI